MEADIMIKKMLLIIMLVGFFAFPFIMADTSAINQSIAPADKAKFDDILKPVMKIYNFVKYISSVVAGIFLLYAGIAYMSSGNDPRKIDEAKNIAMYVIIGMIIIWGAPYIVG